MSDTIDIMTSYRIYCRLPGKRNASPLGGGTLVSNLIHADIFEVRTESDAERLLRKLDNLASANPGKWELRKAKGWPLT